MCTNSKSETNDEDNSGNCPMSNLLETIKEYEE
jgi:hypothetical protein